MQEKKRINALWQEFGRLCSDVTGLYVAAYDRDGRALPVSSPEPPLCALLSRYRASKAACLEGCRGKLLDSISAETIISARCYGGLSYRIIPVIVRGESPVLVMLGKVITDISGDEQAGDFANRYRLDRGDLANSMRQMRHFSEGELDRLARLVQRIGIFWELQRKKTAQRGTRLARGRQILAFARQIWEEADAGKDQLDKVLEVLAGHFNADGAALVLTSPAGSGQELIAAAGIDGPARKKILDLNWKTLFKAGAEEGSLFLSDSLSLWRIGLEAEGAPVVICRLGSKDQSLGYVVVLGGADEEREGDLLALYCRFLEPRLLHEQSMRTWRRKRAELGMLEEAEKRIAAAERVNDILPRTLEETMHMLRSRRGSILLADSEDGRITDMAFRGNHAELTGMIKSIQPDSVSHRVFFEKTPLLVRDANREVFRQSESRFPYSTQSFISVPLRENGHSLGVVHLTEREGNDAYTAWDLSLLDMVSRQAAAAIQKARLLDEVENYRTQALTDSLTGLYNRRYLDTSLEKELARANRFQQAFSVLMIDIDDFKVINDEVGHLCGDRILRELALELQGWMRTTDIISRYGGEEFVIVPPGTEQKGAIGLAEKLRAHVEAALFPCGTPAQHRKLTISAGVATFPDNAVSPQDMLEKADQALRQAKGLGKNMILPWRAH